MVSRSEAMVSTRTDNGLTVILRQDSPIPLDVDVSCGRGELLALLGPSGSGKSTILRAIAGLYRPKEGWVVCGDATWLDTRNRVAYPPHRRSVGMVFQSYALFPHMSAMANVMAAMGHIPPAEREERARSLLARTRIAGLEKRYPATLSGGQQQRIAVARALARDPAVLLLDEPFSAVDRATRQKLHIELAELRRGLNMPTVLVTHDLEEASSLADRLCILHHGTTIQTGTPQEVKARPKNATVARLLEIRNIFEGTILRHDEAEGVTELAWRGHRFRTSIRREFTVGEAVDWCIPTADVILHRPERASRGDAENPVSGVIADMLPLGETIRVTVAIGNDGNSIAVPVLNHVVQRNALKPGRKVSLSLRAEGIHLMPATR